MANHQCRYNNILTEPFLRQRYLEDGTSANAIAQEVGINAVTVRQYLQRYHIPLRTHAESKHTPVDYAGFDNLSDDWHAYWIRFLAADGCVYVNEDQGHAKVNLSVEASDIAHLQRFQQGLQTAAKVHVRSNGGGYNHHGKVAVISISNPHLVRVLAKWGIVPQQSLSLAWPIHFPAHLLPAYIRGYFDGDGTIYLRHRLSRVGTEVLEAVCRFTSGSLTYLEALQKELSLKGIKSNPIYRNQQSNTFVLPLSSRRKTCLFFPISSIMTARFTWNERGLSFKKWRSSMRNIYTQDSTSDFKRVNRGYMLREDLILDCKRIALEDGRKLYEVMEEALAEYIEHRKEGKAHDQGYQSAEF